MDHLLCYRQEVNNVRSGLHTPRSTLVAWSGPGGCGTGAAPRRAQALRVLRPCAACRRDASGSARPGSGQDQKAYVWAYARGALERVPGVIYDFCLERTRSPRSRSL
ncbi:hypothetical protein [Variovorax paradoxus]|uniref:hypothetical protein n=1 Tax=Variovorax paradoxus TaxID=34073 RepID=UPI0038D0FBC4